MVGGVSGSPRPAWHTGLIVAVVVMFAIAVALAFVVFLGRPSETSQATPSPTGSPSGSPIESPGSAASPDEAEPVVEPPDDILPPGSFARVVTDSLNLRLEPGTGAGLVTTLASGELVSVGYSNLRVDWGPVDVDGLSWYPVLPLETSELPPVPALPLEPTVSGWGWVAAGDPSEPFLELVPARCVAGEPDLEILQSLQPWERLACYGDRLITIEGVSGCGGCGGLFPGTFEPQWLAAPLEFDFLSVEPQDRIGPMGLFFPPDVDPPDPASILRLTGHFDDPAAANCIVEPGEPPDPVDDQVAELYCRERFVVDSYEVLGIDEDFPTG